MQDARGIYLALAEELFTVFGPDQVHVSRLAQDGRSGRGSMFRPGPDGKPEIELDYVLSLHGRSAVRRVAETGKPFNVSNARASSIVNPELIERFNVASALFTPIAFDDEVRAVVVMVSEKPREFGREEVELVYTMANQAAAGLAVLETRERISAQADRQAALARAAQALNARLDLRAVLDTLCREADQALGADIAGVYLGDARNGGVGVAADGLPEDSDWFGYVIRPGEGVGGQVLVTGEPAISNDYQHDVELPEAKDLQKIETAVSVPVRWNGQLKGALSVAFYSMRRIDQQDIDTLQTVADLAAVACSNAEAFEQAQTAARTDSLTGFLNHGAVQVRIREEIWRARRTGSSLCCLLVDLDNFKPINDRHGHLVGDEILQRIATAITNEFRPYDGIARFGGDEFVLVLPGRRRRATRSRPRSGCASSSRAPARTSANLDVPITASVGIAQWREPLTAAELLDRADRALLLAKQRGKDGVEVATTETEQELAELDRHVGTSPSGLTGQLWDLISQCDGAGRGRAHPAGLPAPHARAGGGRPLRARGRGLRRPAAAGDRGRTCRATRAPSAFPRRELLIGAALMARLETGPISRGSLPELEEALELTNGDAGTERGPAGSFAALVLARGDRFFGLLVLRHGSPDFPLPVLRMAELLGTQAVTALLGQSGDGSPAAVAALAAAIDARDNYTHSHSEQVVALATEVARRLGLSDVQLEQVRDGAMLHDVGKVAIPNEILFKPGPLTRRRVGDHARAPGDRGAHPAAHARAQADRHARAPRARALGRAAATRTAWPRTPSRSAAGSSSPVTPTTR